MHPKDTDSGLPVDPLWYKDAVIYQVHVKSFYDSKGDGIGDFRGLTRKLDYLQDLGITAVWLLPFYPSPLKDDGYDISDYTSIHPSYGTTRDFNQFLREAHKRGIRIITELIINHTSDQHPWFQEARRSPRGSKKRNYYVWSDTNEKYKGVRIIFKDFETSNWTADPEAGQYYWHRFYSHQPDLNYDNPAVRKMILKLVDLWMKRGVDGMRLDAVPYLYEREGTSCENLPETHAFLRELRSRIDSRYSDRMLLAEANMWPEDAVAYFGKDDECQMALHFPIMPRLFMAIRMENRFPIIDILSQTPAIPPNSQWAMFLRNHDELTLEMVTDKERDYMYQVYARDREMRINLGIRRRLAPLLDNDRKALELMNSLLLSLPGTPIIYYGDEIGMGDNVFLGDRNGVRTPMQWSADRNAGFSRANPQRLFLPVIIDPEYHYESINVENQERNPRSLLWWKRHILALRKRYKAFGRGDIEFLRPSNPRILAFLRLYENERILIAANLSRLAQSVEFDLEPYAGLTPVEIFGRSRFPVVKAEEPYRLTLSPYGFYWFSLEKLKERLPEVTTKPKVHTMTFNVKENWENIFQGKNKSLLERRILRYLIRRKWYDGGNRRVERSSITEDIRIASDGETVHLLFIQVLYYDGTSDFYSLPLSFAPIGEKSDRIKSIAPGAIVSLVKKGDIEQGMIFDAMWDRDFIESFIINLFRLRSFKGKDGKLRISRTKFMKMFRHVKNIQDPKMINIEQTNTSINYDHKLFFKLFRIRNR